MVDDFNIYGGLGCILLYFTVRKYALIFKSLMELISRTVEDVPSRASHGAMYKAMGLNEFDLSKPIVGVSSTCNEATPCNNHLVDLAQHSKKFVSIHRLTLYQ